MADQDKAQSDKFDDAVSVLEWHDDQKRFSERCERR